MPHLLAVRLVLLGSLFGCGTESGSSLEEADPFFQVEADLCSSNATGLLQTAQGFGEQQGYDVERQGGRDGNFRIVISDAVAPRFEIKTERITAEGKVRIAATSAKSPTKEQSDALYAYLGSVRPYMGKMGPQSAGCRDTVGASGA